MTPGTAPAHQTTTPPRRRVSRRRHSAFTLVELLTSVFIIVIIMLIVFPVIGAMKNGSRIEAGLNTVSLASDVTRAWSTASLPQLDRGSDPINPVFGATYSGTAAIFCPNGEVRITINDQLATDGGVSLESNIPNLNGYVDYRVSNGGKRDLDYLAIPQGSGIVGIRRDPLNGLTILAPPFAIAYDESGTLTQEFVFYDSDYDGDYATSTHRGNVAGGYDPRDWDGGPGSANEFPHPTALVRELPFDTIDTVAGVIVYDISDFEAEGLSFSGGGFRNGLSAEYQWLRENGTVVFFSPNTGVAMRDEGTE